MARITAKQLEIYTAHAEAYKTGKWDYPENFNGNLQDLLTALKEGKTVKGVWEEIVTRYVSITSQLLASPELFNHQTGAFAAATRKGFKEFLTRHGIV